MRISLVFQKILQICSWWCLDYLNENKWGYTLHLPIHRIASLVWEISDRYHYETLTFPSLENFG